MFGSLDPSRRPAYQKPISSFLGLTEEQIDAHLAVRRYGDFELTDAVTPSYDLRVVPRQGYRHETYTDPETGGMMPALMVAATREVLWDLFEDLLEPLGDDVAFVLETSHTKNTKSLQNGHRDFYREHIDLPVLKSTLHDHLDLLLNDGCTGIAVTNPSALLEVQLDEHKLITIYAKQLSAFERILRGHGVFLDQRIKFITEAEHAHSTSERYRKEFNQLAYKLGMESDDDEDLFNA
ncbi:MAG TPA: hypothetical protein VHA78_02225 [Candidatus Peribacteraceae bacterium]|nr:hypothetical protein [Candidatus Peribacteraceae bacterium]